MFRELMLFTVVCVHTQSAFAGGEVVHALEFGERWPFTVDSVELVCRDYAVFLVVDARGYALNPIAKREGHTNDFGRIHKVDSDAKAHARQVYQGWVRQYGIDNTQLKQIVFACATGVARGGLTVETSQGIVELSCPPGFEVGDLNGVRRELEYRGFSLCE